MELYTRENGNGDYTFFMIHGNSSSSKCFEHQLNSNLSQTYKLYAVDLPGHGQSAASEDTNVYSIPGYASALLNHIEQQALENVILVGWSLGGHIALEMLAATDKFKGVVIFGTPPLGIPPAMDKAFLPNEAVNYGFTAQLDRQSALAYASSFFKKDSTIDLKDYVEDILKTDGNARSSLVPNLSTIGYADEVEVVKNATIPICIIHGQQEQLVNKDYLEGLTIPTLWKHEIQYIHDSGHAPQIETPEQFNELLVSFAQSL